ncbi:MAG: NADH-quinone oxidoreductase subunit NuoK [Acidiferrobacter sp.]
MTTLDIALVVAGLVFFGGLTLILLRREILFILLGVELLFMAAMVVALVGGARWQTSTGQVLVIVFMAVSGAALALTLAVLLRVKRELHVDTVEGLRHLGGRR